MHARTDKHPLPGLIALCFAIALAMAAALVVASPAAAAGDDVETGNLRLRISGGFSKQLARNGVKMTPRAFKITEGAINPLTGRGEVDLKGKIRFKQSGDRVDFRQLTATLPGEGESGSLKGKGTRRYGVLADKPTKLFSLKGGKVARDGFGARIRGIKVRFLPKAAKRVNRKLGLDSLRGARAGSLSVKEQPKTVEVTGGSARLTPDPRTADFSGNLAWKLKYHCISFVSGNSAVPPGIKDTSDESKPFYVFPLSGGTVSPQGNDGVVEQAGGLRLENRRQGAGVIGACNSEATPIPRILEQPKVSYNLLKGYVSTYLLVTGPEPPLGGDRGEGIGFNLDSSNATVSADPDAHVVNINGIVVRINKGGALNLNQIFPQPTFDPLRQFAAGDLQGTLQLSLTTR